MNTSVIAYSHTRCVTHNKHDLSVADNFYLPGESKRQEVRYVFVYFITMCNKHSISVADNSSLLSEMKRRNVSYVFVYRFESSRKTPPSQGLHSEINEREYKLHLNVYMVYKMYNNYSNSQHHNSVT